MLELTFDEDNIEAEAFHKTIYNLRQRRWTQPSKPAAVQPDVGDSKRQ